MARSRIKNFKSRAMRLPGRMPGVLVRLMVAVNDIALAADADAMWASVVEPIGSVRGSKSRRHLVQFASVNHSLRKIR